ncbi:hypothetical protein ACH40E_18325 [Streptomyces acidicola]
MTRLFNATFGAREGRFPELPEEIPSAAVEYVAGSSGWSLAQ